MKILKLVRIPYGKKDTPFEKREYQINGLGPVGTIEEWEDFAKANKYDGLDLVEVYYEISAEQIKEKATEFDDCFLAMENGIKRRDM